MNSNGKVVSRQSGVIIGCANVFKLVWINASCELKPNIVCIGRGGSVSKYSSGGCVKNAPGVCGLSIVGNHSAFDALVGWHLSTDWMLAVFRTWIIWLSAVNFEHCWSNGRWLPNCHELKADPPLTKARLKYGRDCCNHTSWVSLYPSFYKIFITFIPCLAYASERLNHLKDDLPFSSIAKIKCFEFFDFHSTHLNFRRTIKSFAYRQRNLRYYSKPIWKRVVDLLMPCFQNNHSCQDLKVRTFQDDTEWLPPHCLVIKGNRAHKIDLYYHQTSMHHHGYRLGPVSMPSHRLLITFRLRRERKKF